MTVNDILIRAKHRIRTPSRWISYWCVSEDGKRLCAAEAIAWASGADNAAEMGPEGREALQRLADASGYNRMWTAYERVAYLNGDRKHRDVMAAFDRAIENSDG